MAAEKGAYAKRRACARVPHHVTAFFIPHHAGTPEETGSAGAGLVVEPPAKVCVDSDAPAALSEPEATVARLLGFEGVGFEVYEPLPRGYGFATSAAVALGVALAGALQRGLPVSRAFRAAHVAEVENSTGLGDVLAISMGGYGVAVRLKPGAPGVGEVDYIPVPRSVVALAVASGRMETRELLTSYTPEVRRAAEDAYRRLLDNMTFESFVEEAQRFALETGSLRRAVGGRVEEVMRTPGLVGAYAKKRLAILIVEEDKAFEAAAHLRGLGFESILLDISGGGPRVGWV